MNEIRIRKIQLPFERYPGIQNHISGVYSPEDWVIIDAADENGLLTDGSFPDEILQSAYCRGILDKQMIDGNLRYRVADFLTRVECMATGEPAAWAAITGDDFKAIGDVMMDPNHWLAELVESVQAGKRKPSIVAPLEDAIRLIEDADGIFTLRQCNCNAFLRGCERDKSATCINVAPKEPAFNTLVDRGLCQIVSKEEAIEAVKRTDEMGLVHSLSGSGAGMCNCCTCCCYDFVNMDDFPIRGVVRLIPYRATVDAELCIGCESCVSRCQFGALQLDGAVMSVDQDLCWGCGVCRQDCPTDAISMIKI